MLVNLNTVLPSLLPNDLNQSFLIFTIFYTQNSCKINCLQLILSWITLQNNRTLTKQIKLTSAQGRLLIKNLTFYIRSKTCCSVSLSVLRTYCTLHSENISCISFPERNLNRIPPFCLKVVNIFFHDRLYLWLRA